MRGKRKTLTIQCTKCDAKVIYDGKESDDGKVILMPSGSNELRRVRAKSEEEQAKRTTREKCVA